MNFTEVNASLAVTKTVLVELGGEDEWTEPIDVRGYRFLYPMFAETDAPPPLSYAFEVSPTPNGPWGQLEERDWGGGLSPGDQFHSSCFLTQANNAQNIPLIVPFIRFKSNNEDSENRSFYLHCSS
jgi:hypothetical protein